MQEEIDIYLEGKDMDIAFNVRYISDVLKVLEDEEICLRFNSNVSPCVICPPEGEEYTYQCCRCVCSRHNLTNAGRQERQQGTFLAAFLFPLI